MTKLLNDTKINLMMGLRLAFFRKADACQFIINPDQLLTLLILDLSLNIALGYVLALPNPSFISYALPAYCLNQSIWFLLAYGLAKLWKRPELFLNLSVTLFSTGLILNLFNFTERYLSSEKDISASYFQYLAVAIAVYCYAVLGRVCYVASGRLRALTILALAGLIATGILESQYYGDYQDFWSMAEDDAEPAEDGMAEYRAMDAEKLMYSQPRLLVSALNTLKPQIADRSDVFFVGFAGFATEDVFSKEVVYAKNLLDGRFGTSGHSINLINHLSTRETQPLASATNLAATLGHIGALMNKEEDVLFLYLTSHGSEDHKLAVSFWPLALNDINPNALRAMLDQTGIKWRVIVISACYSGGFVNALMDDGTLVATAAAEDKTSFGCGTESEFTYFGEALFKQALPHETSFVSALQQVRTIIDNREKLENIEASSPQLWIGKAMLPKLEKLGAEIKAQQCGGGAAC